MGPSSPSANPTSSNTNQPFGGFGQAQSDFSSASNILNYLPTQESQTTQAATNANSNPGSILPNISINAPMYSAPTAQTINAGSYGTNLTGYNTAVQNAQNVLTSQENSILGQAEGQLSSAEQQYGNLTPVYQQLASEYNIPGYQKDVATLSNLLQNLDQDVNSQTTLGGGAITQSARDEMYANEAKPLNIALSNAGEFLNYGQQDVSNLLDTYEKSLSNALTPLETNISNLPGMFNQTNQSAESGYGQGATAIQNTIQNQQEAQRIAIERAQAASQEAYNAASIKEINANYGNGGSLANAIQTGQLKGLTPTAAAKGSTAGFNFNVANTPVTAATWASANGVPISTLLAYMAQKGDKQALTAMQDVGNNVDSFTLQTKYPSIFGQSASTSTTSPPTPAQIASSNIKSLSPETSTGFFDSLFNQLSHPSQWF